MGIMLKDVWLCMVLIDSVHYVYLSTFSNLHFCLFPTLFNYSYDLHNTVVCLKWGFQKHDIGFYFHISQIDVISLSP